MRKIDYTILSNIINSEINDLKKHPRESSEARIRQCEFIAYNFASQANVDGEEFLKQCGVKK